MSLSSNKKSFASIWKRAGRSRALPEEYNLGKGTLRYWLKNTRKECNENPNAAMTELERLRKQNTELRKENQFLKKAATFFAKEID